MKKAGLLLIGLFILSSCGKEDADILPDEYELVKLEYMLTSTDSVVSSDSVCHSSMFSNPTAFGVAWSYNDSVRYTEHSNFRDMDGRDVVFAGLRKVGTPNISLILSEVAGTPTPEMAAYLWDFGVRNAKQMVRKPFLQSATVSPYTKLQHRVKIVFNKGVLTYIATLRKKGDLDTFVVEGKWEGSLFSHFDSLTITSGLE